MKLKKRLLYVTCGIGFLAMPVLAVACGKSGNETGTVVMTTDDDHWHDIFRDRDYSSATLTTSYNTKSYSGSYDRSTFDTYIGKLSGLSATTMEKSVLVACLILVNGSLTESTLATTMANSAQHSEVKDLFKHFWDPMKAEKSQHVSSGTTDALVKAQEILTALNFPAP